MNWKIQERIRIEKEIARQVLEAGKKAGYTFAINNGGDEDEEAATVDEAMKLMFETDDETLFFMTPDGSPVGWVYFVYGNDGWDVINDYTSNLSSLIDPICDAASKKYND
jgi:hypothetical protein